MTTHATGTIEAGTWDEQTYAEVAGGPRLTATTGVDHYHGDLECRATYAGLTAYATSGSAWFVSMLRFEGRVGDREGTFVLRLEGAVDDQGATSASWSVLPGSGTGELTGLHGDGGLSYGEGGGTYTLDYAFG